MEIHIEGLIEEVRKRPHIWDKTHKDYRNQHSKLKAFKNISSSIGLNCKYLMKLSSN